MLDRYHSNPPREPWEVAGPAPKYAASHINWHTYTERSTDFISFTNTHSMKTQASKNTIHRRIQTADRYNCTRSEQERVRVWLGETWEVQPIAVFLASGPIYPPTHLPPSAIQSHLPALVLLALFSSPSRKSHKKLPFINAGTTTQAAQIGFPSPFCGWPTNLQKRIP